MRYELPDGVIVQGDTYEEVVQAMANEKMSTPHSLASYRRAVARRAASATGDVIDHRSNESFIKGLIRHDMLRENK